MTLLTFVAFSFGVSAQDSSSKFSNTPTQLDKSISIGSQNFDLSSPSLEIEKSQRLNTIFPKIILDKPVDPDKYVLGVGDTLLLISLGRVNSNISLTVGPEGKIILPDVGDIDVVGLTLSAAKTIIKKALLKKYSNIEFKVLLAQPRVFKIYVLGEVKNPGVYQATPLNRVSDVIRNAGGVTQVGTNRNIELRREGKKEYADLYRYRKNGDLSSNPYLTDKDIIYVPLSSAKVTIGGGVKKPGVYELEGNENLNSFIERIGGFSTDVSYEKPVRISRISENREKTTMKIDLKSVVSGEKASFYLKDGDAVWIPSIDEVASNETNIYVTGQVRKPGPIRYMPGYTAKTYVSMAGGLTPRARYSQAEIIKADGTKIPLKEETILEIGDTIHIPEKFIKVWQDCLVITTSISSLTLAVIAAFK